MDLEGYLVVDNDSDFETEKPNDADMDLGSDEKDVNDNDVIRKVFDTPNGFKDLKCNSSTRDVKKRRRDLRTGCEAFLQISKSKDGKWFVDQFIDSHNHALTITPTKELGQSGLKPCQIKKVVNTKKGPYENDVTSKQCSDILADQRKEYKGKEFYGLIKHFQDKLLEDRNLYFVVDLFEDGSPRNIF
ncbi:protein FAR1-RELATED SEQUENCE 7-like [Helianthus annuus]|uniref:protein FAR1-RELATED SEQUENCE 7-like n=1 Tax=Helianthus annuus TaxID=4232 RepID=UPI000B8F9C47|nr:protein FAR1-RELATED SEQUENCE 7-like [Helianthus annuus]